ncbi:MAG: V-type ATP synthase subunit D [Candidatus Aminicenantes bacterium]|nr:V-type ATP synthase subunit D [Candidatus Aminicenantes bacterium]
MPAVKLTKSELKRQKDALKRYRRYLPTLLLKKQQLQMVVRQLEGRLAEEIRNRQGLIDGAASWLDLFAEPFPFHEWLRVKSVQSESANIAGVEVPVFKSMDFVTESHDLFMTPPWVDEALSLFARLARFDVEIGLLRSQIGLLDAELRVTSQRVNLFEKVKIPQAIENIRRIHIYLGDQQTAAVVRGKIAKKNLLRRAEAS